MEFLFSFSGVPLFVRRWLGVSSKYGVSGVVGPAHGGSSSTGLEKMILEQSSLLSLPKCWILLLELKIANDLFLNYGKHDRNIVFL